jgi:calcium/calmodulin-dependent protein kinase (CaM kinase) II
MSEEARQLIDLTQQLLQAIVARDWNTYERLCASDVTCFEPEACGQLVEGRDFHHYYFQLGGGSSPVRVTLAQPRVRMLGDVAVVAYVRLQQRLDANGKPFTSAWAETRVWQRQPQGWQLVHFHRSPINSSD